MRGTTEILVAAALVACHHHNHGGADSGIAGTARVVHGAFSPGIPAALAPPPATAGHWLLSPSAGTITIDQLMFRTAGGGGQMVSLSGCMPTYHASDAELSSLASCSFSLDPGTYVGLDVGVPPPAQVTINDAVNGLYTTANGLTTTAPAGGAQPASIMSATCMGCNENTIETAFLEPLVVSAAAPPTITILEDMIHTVYADVSSTGAMFDLSLPLAPVQLLATAGDVSSGSVEYYSPVGTAADYAYPPGTTGNETGSARFFFVNGAPLFVWHVTPGPSEAWAADPRGGSGFRAGGYLGLDSTNTLCWAQPAQVPQGQDAWATYAMLCRMQRASALGATTTIQCQSMTQVPPPTSGSTYSSGCPAITPDTTTQVTLVAK